ncbi:ketoacyl-ACP synthase III family protein [Actinoplanes sp. TFC3]|uniref:ketoacyl-ACP synthase III family protein n=1 Tax=Actinoplanes sp. TFC3 TaxID=1710355 RepID=UPI00082E71E6|nr:ketoacyl-ACP synthase III family protein [Actinoplanes sp. TFC3]
MKLREPIGLSAGSWYPPGWQSTGQALAGGELDSRSARDLGYAGVPVATTEAPPEMAVSAARAVLDRAGCPAETLSLVLHASVHHQGHDAWSAPHFIADRLDARRAIPIGLLQQCNGGAAGIDLIVSRLQGDPDAGPGLVTTADRFLLPSWDRWRGDYGMAAGDGATAVLVHRLAERPAELELHATASTVAADLEIMHRGNDTFEAAPLGHGPINVRRPKRDFIAAFGGERFVKTAADAIRTAVRQALRDAGLAGDDERLRYAVLPRLGARAMQEAYIPPLAELTGAEQLDLGRSTGHLGAGDLNASLADLATTDLLAPGQYALVLNGGGGFTWTAMVVRRPSTPTSRPSTPTSRPSTPTSKETAS